jgi:hypothetical protein
VSDKLFHFLAGIVAFAVVAPFGWTLAGAAVLAAGAGKEVWDRVSGKGTPDALDAVATFAGGAALAGWLALAERATL